MGGESLGGGGEGSGRSGGLESAGESVPPQPDADFGHREFKKVLKAAGFRKQARAYTRPLLS